MDKVKHVFVICGSMCTGKTYTAKLLCKKYNLHHISHDHNQGKIKSFFNKKFKSVEKLYNWPKLKFYDMMKFIYYYEILRSGNKHIIAEGLFFKYNIERKILQEALAHEKINYKMHYFYILPELKQLNKQRKLRNLKPLSIEEWEPDKKHIERPKHLMEVASYYPIEIFVKKSLSL